MRLKTIEIENFKGFKELVQTFDPNFTVFVGENGVGKSSMLDAIAFSLTSWPNSMGGHHEFDKDLVRLESDSTETSMVFRECLPLRVTSEGIVGGKTLSWSQAYGHGNSTFEFFLSSNDPFTSTARELFKALTVEDILPIVAYFTADRGRKTDSKTDWNQVLAGKPQRSDGYLSWNDSSGAVSGLSNWLGRQEAIAFQENREPVMAQTVKSAIISCVPGARDLRFSAKEGEPVIIWEDGSCVAFSNLSHGQKGILALVGDIARRCAMLNPYLEKSAPSQTAGVVLIDELDLHLHPRWQRRIVDDLKRTFPKIQFIATTHSPFIIQSLEPGELRILGGEEPKIEYSNRGIEEIVRFIQGVDMPHTSERYAEQKKAAKSYFDMLRDGKTEDDPEVREAKLRLDSVTAHMSDNPALDAMIESKTQASSAMVNED